MRSENVDDKIEEKKRRRDALAQDKMETTHR